MANETTANYWSVSDPDDGTQHRPLNTYAYNITTLGGDALGARPLRGENILIPGRHGERFLPKVVDSFTMTFFMWVQGSNADGTVPANAEQKFLDNYRWLRRLLWRPAEEFNLRKRFKTADGINHVATGRAQYVSGLEPSMTGSARASLAVDLFMADPFFYEAVNPITLVNGRQNIVNAGDAPSQRIVVRINGVRGAVTIFNRTTGVSFTFNDALSAGQYIDVDVLAFTAKNQSGIDMAGSISHSGAPFWMELKSGVNDIEVISTTGTGTITISYSNAWL